MKLIELIRYIKKSAKNDPCPQYAQLIQWVESNLPQRSEYDRKRYVLLKERKRREVQAVLDKIAKKK